MVETVLQSRFPNQKPLAFVHTYGCQGNVADGEKIKGILVSLGYDLTDEIDRADLVLYNTCAIREHAQDRVFGNVGKRKAWKEADRGRILALCGCMMQQSYVADKIKKSYPYVDLVFGTHVIHKLPEFIYRCLCTGKRVCRCIATARSRHGCRSCMAAITFAPIVLCLMCADGNAAVILTRL